MLDVAWAEEGVLFVPKLLLANIGHGSYRRKRSLQAVVQLVLKYGNYRLSVEDQPEPF